MIKTMISKKEMSEISPTANIYKINSLKFNIIKLISFYNYSQKIVVFKCIVFYCVFDLKQALK